MPRRKVILSLYEQSLQALYKMILDFCSYLDIKYYPDKGLRLKRFHSILTKQIPTSILDDLLFTHNRNDSNYDDPSLVSYYFYRVISYQQMKYFKARNYKLKLCYWKSLFKSYFGNLITLNLSLTCNDQILELIPKYCPKLENLNATCKYERIIVGVNACTYALTVTDYGLNFLCKCKNLRTLAVNEPRSNNPCRLNGITFNGLRKLLIEIPTLEDISYSDLGSVISNGLDCLPSLNLRIIRHFNANEKSIREILRLCINLKELYLSFFNNEQQNNLWLQISKSQLKLNTLEIMNFNCRQYFNDIFEKIGPTLTCLSITSPICYLTFSNLLTIGRYCKNLKYFTCTGVCNRNEICQRPKKPIYCTENDKQFTKLESLHLHGGNIDVENVLKFFTEYSFNLEILCFGEDGLINHDAKFIDKLFTEDDDCLQTKCLKRMEISKQLPFTTNGLRKIIKKFPLLNYLSVYCIDDCRYFMQEIIEKNYDLVFINKSSMPFS